MPAVEWLPWWSSRILHIWDLWLWHFAWDIDIEKNWSFFNIKSLVKVNRYTNVKGTNVVNGGRSFFANIPCTRTTISSSRPCLSVGLLMSHQHLGLSSMFTNECWFAYNFIINNVQKYVTILQTSNTLIRCLFLLEDDRATSYSDKSAFTEKEGN